MLKKVLFILFLFASGNILSQTIIRDSTLYYHELSKDRTLSLNERIKQSKKAVKFSSQTGFDSLQLKTSRNLAYLYLLKRDYDSLRIWNHSNLKLAEKLDDSSSIAMTCYYLGYYHRATMSNDSAYFYYYKASKLFNSLNDLRNEGEVLYNMANIQFDEKDYLGAESNAIKSLRLIQSLPRTENNLDTLWSIFNLLGIISDQQGLYDQAIEYYEEGMTYSSQIEDHLLYDLHSFSNIALIYKEQKNYEEALKIYDRLLQNKEELMEDPGNYATILSEFAAVKYYSGNYKNENISSLFGQAYHLADSLNEGLSIMWVSLYASEYYLEEHKKDSALIYANRAFNLGKETNSNDVILRSLLLKSQLEDEDKAKSYLRDYITLSDSLQVRERATRNKFARIAYETDNLKERNKQIARERMYLLIFSGALMLTFLLIYVIVNQRNKNKELQFVQKQQKANEEIYNLMLSQQDKIDEARVLEKKRISQELHDGVLGRLFGTRLTLDSLNMMSNEEAIETRGKYIHSLKEIEEDIRKVSHELNTDFVAGSGYFDIIKTLVETQTEAYGLKFELYNDSSIDWDDVSNKTKIHIYRIVQESLQNIYKHAQATKVEISFKAKKDVICLEISDDGLGFDVEKSRKGIGLKNMTSRVKEIDGEFHVESQPGAGTTLTILTPI
ncbi:ATP-binding protein [Mangrovimonas sp. CR14]|uniref:tetratricopeptide repeat-containing sensor histidine kinase n=1 Tax=Mangrovimonas sp. CR14 TaxID=2706120 RepID=UPI001F10C922|nr:ATP-binding protein [Mangrovimonas sp. CR14]